MSVELEGKWKAGPEPITAHYTNIMYTAAFWNIREKYKVTLQLRGSPIPSILTATVARYRGIIALPTSLSWFPFIFIFSLFFLPSWKFVFVAAGAKEGQKYRKYDYYKGETLKPTYVRGITPYFRSLTPGYIQFTYKCDWGGIQFYANCSWLGRLSV